MRRFEAVNQFHSGTALGDAVTQQMLYLRSHLREMGVESEIYAEHVDPQLLGEIHPLPSYFGTARDLLIWHHSMGNDAFDALIRMHHDIVVMYHNVTPEEFFQDQTVKYYALLGREQLRALGKRAVGGLAASNYNRKEMLAAGFRSVDVLPARTDFNPFVPRSANSPRGSDWLFVGRIVPNKCQDDLVEAFAVYCREYDPAASLVLVGDTSNRRYVARVRQRAERLGVSDRVRIAGKVQESDLIGLMHRAGVYVSLSEHEGFGVPLLEAMAAGLPVVAYGAAAIPETMAGAGMLLRDKSPDVVAAAAASIWRDQGLRQRLVDRQHERVCAIQRFDTKALLGKVVAEASGATRRVQVQVQGPFETSYSLAIMNRKLALGLAESSEVDVSIYATEGPGDYTPSTQDLVRVPEARLLYDRSVGAPYPDVVIRQMWPPRVIDSPGGITCSHFGWEESLVPPEIVRDFNSYVDGIGAMSEFVRMALRKSGVRVPIHVVGNGVERPDPDAVFRSEETADLRAFRFLHISSAFPRKGVDALLRAYFAAFDGESDVSLVLKTFPNPHNDVRRVLDELCREHLDPPDVRWIDRDLGEPEIHGLYNLASCYVHPARGEGFGLPVAEAMLAGVPVVALPYSGLADFVSEDTAITVSYRLEPAKSHFGLPGSEWAEPDHESLISALTRAVDEGGSSRSEERVIRARALIEERYSWPAAVSRWRAMISDIGSGLEAPRVAMVSTWNSKCGIAEYTSYLAGALRERADFELFANHGVEILDTAAEGGAVRCWWDRWKPDLRELSQELTMSSTSVLHVQFNYGFFELGHLAALIREQRESRGVIVTLHRTSDALIDGHAVSLGEIRDALSLADYLIVHQRSDVDRLAAVGVAENVVHIEHGAASPPPVSREELRASLGVADRPVIATFGFLLPHKGTMRLIELADHLRSDFPGLLLLALTALHPDPISEEYATRVRAEVAKRGLEDTVRLVTDYLSDSTARALLRSADAIVLPYDPTEESASGAARFVLPAERPIVASDLPIFSDMSDAILTFPTGDQKAMERAVRSVLADEALRDDLARRAAERALAARWDAVALRHLDLYRMAARAGRARSVHRDDGRRERRRLELAGP